MDVLTLARLQFAVTTVYHFFFVPLTLGLAISLAVMETIYVKTGNEEYKKMTKFWGKLFLINFAMGVVTGIVQEFQFGMNWSEYSRFVGDIFGAPLAIEALVTFFLESVFLGVWIFGWDKLSKKLHCVTIWLVAIGSFSSAFWIMVANSFMQEPRGFEIVDGRAQMVDFGALLTNPHFHLSITHVTFAALTVAAFFIIGISVYHLCRKTPHYGMFKKSFILGSVLAVIATHGVAGVGHFHAQHVGKSQPMKMAAAEALWHTEDPAAFEVIAWIDEEDHENEFSVRVPYLLSILSHNVPWGEVKGIDEVQQEYVSKYGPGDYIPPVNIVFWSFRIMIVVGTLLIVLAIYALVASVTIDFRKCVPKAIKIFPWVIILPYVATTTGWLVTEVGRQPWVVQGLMTVEDGVSKGVTAGEVLFSLIGFTLIYGLLMGVDIFLLARFSKRPELTESH